MHIVTVLSCSVQALLGYALLLICAEANIHLHCIHICFLARNVCNAQALNVSHGVPKCISDL